ncbi:MAG TPA: hypothetical protein VFK44_03095 [Bacillales bacterium]|nr:hypothetical protein [Bacillales bacterium]
MLIKMIGVVPLMLSVSAVLVVWQGGNLLGAFSRWTPHVAAGLLMAGFLISCVLLGFKRSVVLSVVNVFLAAGLFFAGGVMFWLLVASGV